MAHTTLDIAHAIQVIDSRVRATLHKVYKDKITLAMWDTISFKDTHTMLKYNHDYKELTKIYLAEFGIGGTQCQS